MTDMKAKAQAANSKEVRPPYRVVVGTDLSALGDRAVLEALKLCDRSAGSELHVLCIADDQIVGVRLPGQEVVQDTKHAQAYLCNHVAKLVELYVTESGGISLDKIATYVTTGLAAERIISLAASVDADLIVVGTHGRTGIKRLLLGSVAEEVVRRAPCGVFVARPPEFLDGEKVPDVQPPLRPGEHALQPFRHTPTYHYIDRAAQATQRIMPAI
jgi:nucleotide-binding universal stress UspA family protein